MHGTNNQPTEGHRLPQEEASTPTTSCEATPPAPSQRCVKCNERSGHPTLHAKPVAKPVTREACSEISTRDGREKAVKGNYWECPQCVHRSSKPEGHLSDTETTEKSEPKSSKFNRPLRILQWNVEGINTNTELLKCFLQEYTIDVALIQESKLLNKSKTPVIKGWTPIRAGREDAEFSGGGLITYVKEDIAFKTIGHCKKVPVEVLSVGIQQKTHKW